MKYKMKSTSTFPGQFLQQWGGLFQWTAKASVVQMGKNLSTDMMWSRISVPATFMKSEKSRSFEVNFSKGKKNSSPSAIPNVPAETAIRDIFTIKFPHHVDVQMGRLFFLMLNVNYSRELVGKAPGFHLQLYHLFPVWPMSNTVIWAYALYSWDNYIFPWGGCAEE